MKLRGRIISQLNNRAVIELFGKNTLPDNAPVEIGYKAQDANQELRGLLWLFLEFLGDELGYTAAEMYIIMKDQLHFYETITGPDGKQIKIYRSTSNGEIDNRDLSEFYRKVELWAINQEIDIEPFVTQHNEIRLMRGKQ